MEQFSGFQLVGHNQKLSIGLFSHGEKEKLLGSILEWGFK